MTKTSNVTVLSSSALKIIAMVCMLCDHLWATVVPGNLWMTMVGRLAFPLFAYQVVEGFYHTGNIKKYTRRMFLFALLSELPFNCLMGGGLIFPFHQNVLFSFWLSLLLLRWMEHARQKGRLRFIVIAVLCVVLGYLGGFLLMVDYFGYGILMLLLFYFCRSLPFGWIVQLVGMVYINVFLIEGQCLPVVWGSFSYDLPIQSFAVLALIFIWLYNGKPGAGHRIIRPICYAFYPLHIVILLLIQRLIP